jgi:hypothetical protein
MIRLSLLTLATLACIYGYGWHKHAAEHPKEYYPPSIGDEPATYYYQPSYYSQED